MIEVLGIVCSEGASDYNLEGNQKNRVLAFGAWTLGRNAEANMSNEHEQERLRRIRDRQIQLRDPKVKDRKVQKSVAKKHRSSLESFSLTKIWTELPKIIRGTVIGMLAGLAILLVLPYIFQGAWVDYAGFAAVFILAFLGMIFGQALDARDRLMDV